MPRKAMKCIVEIDLHVITCPGTFLKDYEYVYLHMEMLGLEARTKSVPPTFPLFFHERLKFERTFFDCTDPALVAAILKGEDLIIELRQHTDYITDGKVIAHCSSNTHDFLYPSIPPYYGSGREILLYKTSKFKPIRVTGEPVKLEFTTNTIIKEVLDYDLSGTQDIDNGQHYSTVNDEKTFQRSRTSSRKDLKMSKSNPDLSKLDTENNNDTEFVIRRKDDKVLSNRDFSTYTRPKPRRSVSPTRRKKRSASPSRIKRDIGNASREPIPAYSSTPATNHLRSKTEPSYQATPMKSLRYALDDLDLTDTRRRSRRVYAGGNLSAALNSSRRIQRRVDEVIRKRDYSLESDEDSDYSLDVLRESLREERNALNDAIKEVDREAYYRSLNRSLRY